LFTFNSNNAQKTGESALCIAPMGAGELFPIPFLVTSSVVSMFVDDCIDKEGLETPIERNAKFWCRRAMLEYLNLLYHKHAATWGLIIMFIRW
jgi:hypothetical protein